MRKDEEKRNCECSVVKFTSLFFILSILFWVTVVLIDSPSDGFWSLLQPRNLLFKLQKGTLSIFNFKLFALDSKFVFLAAINDDRELLPTGFHEKSCISRYELPLYRRGETQRASPHLISKLRSYEARHKRCGPHTQSYKKTLVLLESNVHIHNSSDWDCKYIVWIPYHGLGNQMLTLASAFLYALLTDRVLLAHRGKDISDLFCEPFPQASWLLPSDFPLSKHFNSFDHRSNRSYGNLIVNPNSAFQPYVYLNLLFDSSHEDQLFFCDEDQKNLEKTPWLILKSDLYFVPSLFLIPSFQQALHHLFPEKEAVFHLLGRYLFHPTNSVWGLVTRYYQAYLSKADVRVGIQVRVFDNNGPFTDEQILSCIKTENILPPINHSTTINSTTTTSSRRRISVVMASLRSSYFDRIKDMYWENPTETGDSVSVFQPSHEEYQQTEKASHDRKALAEMYLLSLTEKLVTSGWSTFGYVGAALGGVKPWIMYKPVKQSVPEPACVGAMSMEPCFMFPPYYDCKTRTREDPGGVVPYVRHCEDVSWGIKLR